MSLIITKNGTQAQRVDKSTFEAEDNLQQYIFNNPESLPLYEIKEDIRLLILAREFDTESGPIDAIGVDKEGEIYVIETKLYKNADKRFVVAQVLDYGASLWRHSDANSFIAAIDDNARLTFGVDVRSKLQEYFAISSEETEHLLEKSRQNLNSGNFRFVVLMDKLSDKLKDLIVFLNVNTRFDIYAVEMEYYKFAQYEIVIPKLFGSEVKKDVAVPRSTSGRRTWDENSYFEDANANLSKENVEFIRKLYDYSKKSAKDITWGTGATTGSFNPKFIATGNRSPFTVYSSGNLQLSFEYIDESAQDFRMRWIAMLAQQLKFPITKETLYKNVAIDLWGPKVNEFISIFDDLLTWSQKNG